MMPRVNALWTELARRAAVELSADQHAKLSRYLGLLLEANAKMNLTRITDRAAAELQHVADALTVLPHLPAGGEFRLADVGSGGGVPGIPLAVARPDATVLLIESTKKKASFLEQTIAALELPNVSVSEWRAEDVARGNQRETFDIAVARAVATMAWLAEWCLPLVKTGGKMLAMKGPKVNEELPAAARAIRMLGGGEPIIHPVDLPGTDHRIIVEITKLARTDARYPRPPTHAKGKPLA
jgi:16S rRNA (guanine527-N7)-methyltransferase